MIGRTLGGRYMVEARVGGGGMAAVYRGLDGLLHRQVALKVLHSQFADDAEFVARFRREARAAASLSHPNIVAVYDVGQEGPECYYIVQEFVDGRTLKDRIRADGPLPVPEALTVTRQVLRALGHAHAVGVIHRDVKPQNVLLTRDGQVKVTDFGIARAEAGATFVHTGAILGTAHYAAPEQVRGQATDLRCDLYSAGVMLFEMLSGSPPFDGEGPLAVAQQHCERPVPLEALRAARPDAVRGLCAVVAHAMAKSPEERYRSAGEFEADVEALLAGSPPVYAPPAGAELGGVLEAAPAGEGGAGRGRGEVGSAPVPPLGPLPAADARVGAAALGASRAGRDWWQVAAVTAGLVVGVAILAGAAVVVAPHLWTVQAVAVPQVVGESLTGAENAIAAQGLLISVQQEHSTSVPKGEVEQTDPSGGTQVRRGSTVDIWQSLGPPPVTVPDLRGIALKGAEAELRQLGLKGRQAKTAASSSRIPAGFVLQSEPVAGTRARAGSRVTLVLSAGPPGAGTLPDYVGRTLQAVRRDLARRQLTLGTVSHEATGWPAGYVAATAPVSGSPAPAGTQVDLTVSNGCVYQATRVLRAGQGGAAAGGAGASSSTAAGSAGGMHEQVLVQDVGATGARQVFDQTVPAGHRFTVQLCWSSPQGATWTWEENGVVRGSGMVTAATATGGSSASAGGGPAPAGSSGTSSTTGSSATGSSTAGSSTGDGFLPANPGSPGSGGVPADSATSPGPG